MAVFFSATISQNDLSRRTFMKTAVAGAMMIGLSREETEDE